MAFSYYDRDNYNMIDCWAEFLELVKRQKKRGLNFTKYNHLIQLLEIMSAPGSNYYAYRIYPVSESGQHIDRQRGPLFLSLPDWRVIEQIGGKPTLSKREFHISLIRIYIEEGILVPRSGQVYAVETSPEPDNPSRCFYQVQPDGEVKAVRLTFVLIDDQE